MIFLADSSRISSTSFIPRGEKTQRPGSEEEGGLLLSYYSIRRSVTVIGTRSPYSYYSRIDESVDFSYPVGRSSLGSPGIDQFLLIGTKITRKHRFQRRPARFCFDSPVPRNILIKRNSLIKWICILLHERYFNNSRG